MKKALTFEDLRFANVQRNKEWDRDGKLTGAVGALFRATEFAGEVGEVCNNVKKLVREELGIKGSRISHNKLAEEMADVLITLDLLAMHYSIDIGEATKVVFNRKSEEFGFKTMLGEQLELPLGDCLIEDCRCVNDGRIVND